MDTELQNETKLDVPRIVPWHKFKSECRLMMGLMLDRIGRFAEKYCPDTIPGLLMEAVDIDFVKRKQRFLILGALDRDDYLCGHLLADVCVPDFGDKRRCRVMQYELDDNVPIDFLRACLDMNLVDWAKENYCSEIVAETKSEQAQRIFTTFYGFTVDLIQVKRSL